MSEVYSMGLIAHGLDKMPPRCTATTPGGRRCMLGKGHKVAHAYDGSEVEELRQRLEGAVEALRRIAAGHAHPAKLAGEALDALPPDDNVYDPPYIERGQ